MKIQCEYHKLLPLKEFKLNPLNPNKHSSEQIDRLVKLFQYQGIRKPIIVSKQTGLIVVGHGRLMAAEKAGLETYPAVYQDFTNTDQEYAFMISDNSSADWAELDLSAINANIKNMGPDFDIDNLGLKNFYIEPADMPGREMPDTDKKYIIEVEFPSVEDLDETANSLITQGFIVRIK